VQKVALKGLKKVENLVHSKDLTTVELKDIVKGLTKVALKVE